MKHCAPYRPSGPFVLLAAWFVVGASSASRAELACWSDFEGGSGDVLSIDQEQHILRITPTLHKDRGWPCWWYVHVTGIEPGETITLELTSRNEAWAKPHRAAWSVDNQTWHQTSPGEEMGRRMRWQQQIDAAEAWFAWGPPFVPSDAQRLVDQVARTHAFAESFTLCHTRAGRPVPALRIAESTDAAARPYGIWISGRQHAWESGSSWTCRGLTQWLVSDDPRATWLRRHAVIYIVPIMDIDNTFIGAGGKMQKPHDHNRDWGDDAHWASVRAAMKLICELDEEGRFHLFLDIHNPSRNDRKPFFFASHAAELSDLGRTNQERFLQAARHEIIGDLPLQEKVRSTGPGYDKENWMRISHNWVTKNARDHVVALGLEVPWDTPHSTTAGWQTVGRQLGLAIERYFREAGPSGASSSGGAGN